MLTRNLTLLFTFAVVACGSSSSTNIGTVGGVSMNVKESISGVYTVQNANGSYNAATAILGDFSGVCNDLLNGAPAGNALVLSVFDANTVMPGTYSFSSANQGAGPAVFFVNSSGPNQATSGSITLTTVPTVGSNNGLTGSFAATFSNGQVAGSFSATPCSNVNSSTLGTL